MTNFQLRIRVGFKDGILDPQAEAVQSSLKKLEFKAVDSVKIEKIFVVNVAAESESQAITMGREMANKLLANVVMENFDVEVIK